MATKSPDSFTFTVGKLDAGMAILLGERAHLIEFPSLLLPPGATTGSIVNISVTQNVDEERKRDNDFWQLQSDILETFGRRTPQAPEITLRNVTQTSVTLEWPPLDLATAQLRSLDIYKNSQRLASIPSPLQNTSTKLSGLDINTEYTFRLVLRTSAGTYQSPVVRVRTHTMTDTSGISVCFGNVQDSVLLENAKLALQEMHAKWSDTIQIDTTHFVCTTPAAMPSGAHATGSISSAPGVEYQRALQLSIPVVQPHWILACHGEKKMVPIASYYLGTTPSAPINSAPFSRHQSMSQTKLPQSAQANKAANRSSMPPPARTPTSPTPEQRLKPTPTPLEPPAEGEELDPSEASPSTPNKKKGHPRHGTMDREFKFPPPAPPPSYETTEGTAEEKEQPTLPSVSEGAQAGAQAEDGPEEAGLTTVGVVAPSNGGIPPSPTLDSSSSITQDEGEEDVGETEEISLN
ncbi:hypothetical protein EVG20_g3914 [Dentipellis fragilis]|uniref:Fibronectin type-III domain-containing protein n=1 Tax=Dentipellis fragilis TaxID=205917 RepID=A0A4Y9YZ21_9AGAM|nr:hypothetical protein EVG20_g3914 [Dentipellis fragilis]